MNEQELLNMLREAFKEEAVERLTSLSTCLVELERVEPTEVPACQPLEVAFREAHSLKGAARSVSLQDIEALCQSLESVLSQMKRAQLRLATEHFDLLHQCVAVMESFLDNFAIQAEQGCADTVAPLLKQLNALADQQTDEADTPRAAAVVLDLSDDQPPAAPEPQAAPTQPSAAAVPAASDAVAAESPVAAPTLGKDATLRVTSSRLDGVMHKAENLISLKLAVGQRQNEVRQLLPLFPAWRKDWTRLAPRLRALSRGLLPVASEDCRATVEQLLAYVERNHERLQQLESGLNQLQQQLLQDRAATSTMVDELLDEVKEIIMMPFSNLSASFPRMVRDIARSQGKQVELSLRGEETELDKRILDQLSSPLTHLIRNAIDHGIELPQERLAAGKDAVALLDIWLSRTPGGRVEVRICDDGGGIDLERLRSKAVDKGLITPAAAGQLSEEETIGLIFQSGMSTSAMITEISGRGLGMAIVKEQVEALGGHLHVETCRGKGTCFKLHLPVSLSVFKGILVQSRGHELILPTSAVERVVKVPRSEIRTVENREVIVLDGKNLALVDLGAILSITERPITYHSHIQVAVVEDTEQQIGFVVDEVDGEYELLVKGLGEQLKHVRYFSGASVLGDGRVVPVLDARDLLTAPMDRGGHLAMAGGEGSQAPKTILAVDDSITSRMLIKNILEAAGYQVVSAVDGADAYRRLCEGQFDLVVSDVEMPRMNGFELTAQIRATDAVAQVPVILVTSLESAEDKEKGIVAGANAYIVKRSFDQSNLLDTISRLL